MLVQVPALAAAAVPHRPLQFALHLGVETVLRLTRGHKRLSVGRIDLLDRLGDVVDLRLDHEDDRVVAQAGIGSQQEEQVGHARDGDASVRGNALA